VGFFPSSSSEAAKRTQKTIEIELSRLSRSRRLSSSQETTTIMAVVAKLPKWGNSEAKEILQQDLLSGRIPFDGKEWTPQVVYDLPDRPQFRLYPYKNFVTNLRNLRILIKGQTEYAASDVLALAHDRRIYPVASVDQQGAPRWEGSSAQTWLSTDIDDGKHLAMKPQMLHCTREEYKAFKLTTFRKHILQEVTTRKFLIYMKEKAQKKEERRKKGALSRARAT
jgi:hypothetical protein